MSFPGRRAAATLLATMGIGLSMGLGAQAAPVTLPPGCHPEWPVVAHRAGGAAAPASATVPVACATETGRPTSETTIAVSNAGSLIFSPAQTENSLGRSTDQGVSWSLVAPAGAQQSTLMNTVDPQVVVDRQTGRLFWVHATGPDRTAPGYVPGGTVPPGDLLPFVPASGFQVYRSSDDGRTFATADYQTAPMGDWEKIFLGPPTAGGPQPQGYPNVVYVCANSPWEVSGPSRLCYRSLDGGTTFSPAGYVIAPGATQVCPPLAGNTGVVDSHGTVYQPEGCQNGAFLAVSTDEGATYSWVPVTTAPANPSLTSGNIQVAMDSADNLYVTFLNGDNIMLTISRDHGVTWSAPSSITAPGIHGVLLPAIAAGPRGAVTLTYYGRAGSATSGPENAYITQTTTALDAQPLWYSGVINDPAHPIYFAGGLTTYPRADYVGAGYDAAGRSWAGITKQFGPPDSNNNIRSTGYVGRLVSVAAATLSPAPTLLPNTAAGGRPAGWLPILVVAVLAVLGGGAVRLVRAGP